jgi:hypothetical protein
VLLWFGVCEEPFGRERERVKKIIDARLGCLSQPPILGLGGCAAFALCRVF